MKLHLPPLKWSIVQSRKSESIPVKLGDNYAVPGKIHGSDRLSWELSVPDLDTSTTYDLLSLFKSYAGTQSFEWSPHPVVPYKNYTCSEGQAIPQGVDKWEFRVSFAELR